MCARVKHESLQTSNSTSKANHHHNEDDVDQEDKGKGSEGFPVQKDGV